MEEVLDRAAGLLGGPVVLEDLAHRVVAHVAQPVGTAELLVDWSRRSRRAAGDAGVGRRAGRCARPALGPARRPRPARAPDPLLVLDRAAEALTVVRLLSGGGPPTTRTWPRRPTTTSSATSCARAGTTSRACGNGCGPGVEPAHGVRGGRGRRRGTAGGLRGARADAVGGADRMVGRTEGTGEVVGVLLVGAPRVVTAALDRGHGLPEGATLGTRNRSPTCTPPVRGSPRPGTSPRSPPRPRTGRRPGPPHRRPGRARLLWRLRGDARLTAFAEAQLAPLFETPDDLALLTDHLQVNGSMTRLAASGCTCPARRRTAGWTGSHDGWAATWRTPRCASGSTWPCSACRGPPLGTGEEFPAGPAGPPPRHGATSSGRGR